mgnify:CR=1 FL=1
MKSQPKAQLVSRTLTQEQSKIIESKEQKIAIKGLAKSGKTTTAILKCIHLIKEASNASGTFPKILWIAYNATIKANLLAQIKEELALVFSMQRAKMLLACIEVKTVSELSCKIVQDKKGDFLPQTFSAKDIQEFLLARYALRYSLEDALLVYEKLHAYYHDTKNISEIIDEELGVSEDEQRLAYLYDGVLKVLEGQYNLEFALSPVACLKLASSLPLDDIYYDLVLLDEASDCQRLSLAFFLGFQCNRRMIVGDRWAQILPSSFNAMNENVLRSFATFELTQSFDLCKEVCEKSNQILKKLGSKQKILPSQKDCATEEKASANNSLAHLFTSKANMLKAIYQSVKEGKSISVVSGFNEVFLPLFAMGYIMNDFDTRYTDICFDAQARSEEYLSFADLETFVEQSSEEIKELFALAWKWQKSEINILARIEQIREKTTHIALKSDIIFSLVCDAKSMSFDFVHLSLDFINANTITKPSPEDTRRLRELYVAITRGKNGFYIK